MQIEIIYNFISKCQELIGYAGFKHSKWHWQGGNMFWFLLRNYPCGRGLKGLSWVECILVCYTSKKTLWAEALCCNKKEDFMLYPHKWLGIDLWHWLIETIESSQYINMMMYYLCCLWFSYWIMGFDVMFII